MNIPPILNIEQVNFKAFRVSKDCEYESLDQLEPILGAPSFNTKSALLPFNIIEICFLHLSVVISSHNVRMFGNGLMG